MQEKFNHPSSCGEEQKCKTFSDADRRRDRRKRQRKRRTDKQTDRHRTDRPHDHKGSSELSIQVS